MKHWSMLFATVTLLMITPLRAQSADAVYVATYLDLKPASSRAGAALAGQYQRASRAAVGNVMANAYQEIGRSNRFVIIEAWQDQAAFAAHEQAAHTAEFRDQLKAIQHGPYDQRINHAFAIDPMPQTAAANAVYVVTHVDVPGARREEAEVLLKKLSASSRMDAGHLRYDVYQQNDPRTNHFTLFAAWSSQRALAAHGGMVHTLQFREALGPMLGALYDERLYLPIK